jgi:pimeloyl-ACP methyl ester carboxylesterase
MSSIVLAALLAAAMSASSDAPRFGEVKLTTGIRLHYAEQGPATAETIILLHGYSDSWFSYSQVMTPLARGLHVFALDLRGHGKSDQPATGYRMRDLAADVVAFMDAKSIVRATVVGHSMGGLVAQQVALAAPKRVSRLVLIGSPARIVNINGFAEFEKAVMGLTDPVPESFAREFQLSTIHTPLSNEFVGRAVAESMQLTARVWRQLLLGMKETDRAIALGRSGIPILALRGEKDTIVPPAEHDALVAMVRPKAHKTYPNTGHALHWEQPAAFVRDVLEFIRGTA